MRVRRDELLSGEGAGFAVHAGAFPRRREIVLDSGLLARPRELVRILTHELFHFAWVRLGNPARLSYENLLVSEIRLGARGELGWSAEWRKAALSANDRRRRTRRWREYVCESFCDTASWLFGGSPGHAEHTLAVPFRKRRRMWFRDAENLRRISL